jgi:uncharacterized protein YjiS (DUF1127 family)
MTALVANTVNWHNIEKWWNDYTKLREQRRAYRETVKELSKLTDKELRDIGITRGDIHSIAMETHFDNRGAK